MNLKRTDTRTIPEMILLPNNQDVPLIVQPKTENYVGLMAVPGLSIPFKVERAEAVEGIDYAAFECPGMFVGSTNFQPPAGSTWPLPLMLSQPFKWPGGGLGDTGNSVPYIGQVDFHFRVRNITCVPQPFAIKLVGLALFKVVAP